MDIDIKNKIREISSSSKEIENHITVIRPISKVIKYCILGIAGAIIYNSTIHRENLYESALAIHADTNKNNVVSKLEEESFKSNLLEGKDAVFVKDWPMYKNGKVVPYETAKSWIDNYNPLE